MACAELQASAVRPHQLPQLYYRQHPRVLSMMPKFSVWNSGRFPCHMERLFPLKGEEPRFRLQTCNLIDRSKDSCVRPTIRVPKGGSLEPWSPEISAVEPEALSFY